MSLASYTTLSITAIGMAEGWDGLRGIASVRWECPSGDSEESSADDLIRWLRTGGGRAYVQAADGTRGPKVFVAGVDSNRYLCSNPDDETADALLELPRFWQVVHSHRGPTHRRRGLFRSR